MLRLMYIVGLIFLSFLLHRYWKLEALKDMVLSIASEKDDLVHLVLLLCVWDMCLTGLDEASFPLWLLPLVVDAVTFLCRGGRSSQDLVPRILHCHSAACILLMKCFPWKLTLHLTNGTLIWMKFLLNYSTQLTPKVGRHAIKYIYIIPVDMNYD